MAIVDGEHYPPVIEDALAQLAAQGTEIVCAVLAGGREKLSAGGLSRLGSVPVLGGDDPRRTLWEALGDADVDAVVDLSDEPVLDYRRRHELASIALFAGVGYRGPDFTFRPPPRPHLCEKPSIAVIGTGKRTGKTAVAGFMGRVLKGSAGMPAIVAMGRGGPPEPEVVRGDRIDLKADDLVRLADSGRHAASDYIEDALLARVPTVGCRRCGGGLAGGVEISNLAAGIAEANRLPVDLLLVEGSGSAVPPVHTDATVLVVPATIPEEYLAGYMGLYRMLLADFALVTMSDDPRGSPSQVSSLIRDSFRPQGATGDNRGEIQVIRTVFRPRPVRPVEGVRAFVTTTAPETAEQTLRRHLEERYGCEVVGFSHSLADRGRLERELDDIDGRADVLLCEIKAAAIDVAARRAAEAGMDVIFMDNELVAVDGGDAGGMVLAAAGLARRRFEAASS